MAIGALPKLSSGLPTSFAPCHSSRAGWGVSRCLGLAVPNHIIGLYSHTGAARTSRRVFIRLLSNHHTSRRFLIYCRGSTMNGASGSTPTNNDGGGGDNKQISVPQSNSSLSFASSTASYNSDQMAPIEMAKRHAAYACANANISSGMRLGIGSGSTVKYLIDWLEEKTQAGLLHDIQCVPTSYQTRQWLLQARLPTQSLEMLNQLDLTIDGADEADYELNAIKGGGGCLLQEKIVQTCASKFILIGDHDKLCERLGTNYKSLPIEVTPHGCAPVKRWIVEKYGGECALRMDKRRCFAVNTENHNYLVDWYFPRTIVEQNNWAAIGQGLISIPGVVETGLFLGVASLGYFSNAEGKVEVIKKETA